jgi:acyl-CoA dehydrogenase
MFLVTPDSEGVEIRPQPKVGNRVPHSCFVFLDEVQVPDENVLGEVGRGFHQIMQTLNNERILIAAQCLGFGRGALEDAVQYAKERVAFGKPIGQFQAVQHRLAESALLARRAALHLLPDHQRDGQEHGRREPRAASLVLMSPVR